MIWADLSIEAKAILEWEEHVVTMNKQQLVIEEHTYFEQHTDFDGDIRIFATPLLWTEILTYMKESQRITYREVPIDESQNRKLIINEHLS